MMKKLVLFSYLFLFQLIGNAQSCLPDGITFTTQEQVDDFIINYPNCTELLGDIEISGSNLINNLNGLANIVTIKGDLTIWGNENLTNLNGLNNLNAIEGNLDMGENAFVDLSGLNQLSAVGGFIYISDHESLINLEGLNQLETVGEYLELVDNLAIINLQGLNKLHTIAQHLNLDYNPKLESLDGLSSLTTIGTYFVIENHPLLDNIDALNTLKKVDLSVRISNNELLKDLHGLNGLISIGTKFRIFNNDNLTKCAINILCNDWAIGGEVDVFNNAEGCMNKNQILASCNQGISGNVFYDFNQNQQRDSFEVGIPMIEISTVSSNIGRVFTNTNGRYFSPAEEGELYTLSLVPSVDWTLTTDSFSYTKNYATGNPDNQNNDFGLFPNFTRHEFSSNQYANPARCNTQVDFFLKVRNTGTFIETNGVVELIFDELISYVEAIPTPQTIDLTNRRLVWNYDTLYPYQVQEIKISFDMPDETYTGENIENRMVVYRDSMSVLVEEASSNYTTIVRCSYDPNDKLVSPFNSEVENYTSKDERLFYTIRFQNTGNDYAWDVAIVDTLDANLDFSSFRVEQTSHNLQTVLNEEGIIRFLFEDIYLPDSTTNFVESQGFVSYSIRSIDDLADYTVIKNTASIYFDQNPAIVTNTTINTLVDELPLSTTVIKKTNWFDVFPNPATNSVQLTFNLLSTDLEYELYLWNAVGETLRFTKLTENQTLNFSNYPSGIYFLGLKDRKTGEILELEKLVISSD